MNQENYLNVNIANCKKYILVSKLYRIGDPLNAELFAMFNNKVPMVHMPHRNLTTYLTVDENGNHNVVTEKIHKDMSVNMQALNPNLIDDENILDNGFTLFM